MTLAHAFRIALVACALSAPALAGDTGPSGFLVTDDDSTATAANTATFYAINADGTLGANARIPTGGSGISGGSFAASRVIVVPHGAAACAYVADAGSNDIAGIDTATKEVTGLFQGGPGDSGIANGIGLAASSTYLYASYTSSTTIATFQIQPGCTLSFVSDLLTSGLSSGVVGGMAIHGNMMVVTYGDGSIESFDISGGAPVSNGDVQNSTGSAKDHLPNGVIITKDGHYAIFGDASTDSTVEVSDMSSGVLTATAVYPLGNAWNSGNVLLSPDESVLYVSNNSVGQLTAGFFDPTTGKVSKGCTSPSLKGFYTSYTFSGNIGLQLTTGAGGIVYIPEFGSGGRSYLGMLQVTRSGSTCTIAETAASPVAQHAGSEVLSIAVYTPGS